MENNSKLLQVVFEREDAKRASSKAPADISRIAGDIGFEDFLVRDRPYFQPAKLIYHSLETERFYREVTNGSIILLQNPIWYRTVNLSNVLFRLKKQKGVKIISIVHDVEELRCPNCKGWLKNEFNVMLKTADVLVVHNKMMMEYFRKLGFPASRLVDLKIFDYLCTCDLNNLSIPQYEISLNIAGNLSMKKSGYIKELNKLSNLKIDLYGSNLDNDIAKYKNVFYRGSFTADELPNHINSGFGLVWDGNTINTCSGLTGEYLRYNNPHKLSLYLSSGIPVVIWSQAAEADFVSQHGLGICVDSLYEVEEKLDQISETQYMELVYNVNIIRRRLLKGEYTKKALNAALKIINT